MRRYVETIPRFDSFRGEFGAKLMESARGVRWPRATQGCRIIRRGRKDENVQLTDVRALSRVENYTGERGS